MSTDFYHIKRRVLLLDILTGMTAVDERWSLFEIEEGNFSCDCNRDRAFGLNIYPDRGICIGCKRFLIVACEDRGSYTLRDLNNGYPEQMLREFCDGEDWSF